ncbi:hypothetical protein BHU72_01875 [Desulfuribacillus stibiiarsenatis]|uniref:Metallo-beta-lactamase domain-containing protein n=1 Tax=Desulfuribacillus stibiiarsenatis TaxID=1390249 RepID=A0A1E5L625_9FIRM|nr:MBL fold metallo-hydrolase [Desulfuribacillus stibiiarsenatis]OEH85571.1 hypothetical protein BHU72_01875 [Desulfuribacillus stibiiarsenatis]
MSVNIKVLKALHGDCLIITFGPKQDKFILIDGGIGKECYRSIKEFIKSLKEMNATLRLLILTHIDSDHIDGILRLFSESDFDTKIIDRMWFNFGEFLDKELKVSRESQKSGILLPDETTLISWKQGNNLEEILKKARIQYEKAVKNYDEFYIDGSYIRVLSPSLEILKAFNKQWMVENEQEVRISTKTDYSFSIEELNDMEFIENISLANRSSIAFIFEYENRKALFLGDASAVEIEKSLSKLGYSEDNQLEIDICKISHHASKHNTSNNLIRMMKCKNYIISTNLTASGRPTKECLSRIICNSKQAVNFYCNYEIDFNTIFTKEEFGKYEMKFITIDKSGINLEDLPR